MYCRPAKTSFISAVLCLAVVSAALVGCGPELTQPSSTSVSGHWTSLNQIGPLSNLSLNITQQSGGVVGGSWAGKSFPPDAVCPPNLGASPTGGVSGTNTVVEVHLSLVGAGDFDGQLIDAKNLKGSFSSCGTTYPINFSLVQTP